MIFSVLWYFAAFAVVKAAPQTLTGGTAIAGDRSPLCVICTDLLDGAKEAVRNATVKEDVKKAVVDGMCPLIFQSREGIEKCQSNVRFFEPMAFGLIIYEMEPLAVCQDASLCALPPGGSPAKPSALLRLLMPVPQVGSMECDVCLVAVGHALKTLSSNASQAFMAKEILKLCWDMPSGVQTQCRSFIQENIPLVIRLTMRFLDHPRFICELLDYCSDVDHRSRTDTPQVHVLNGNIRKKSQDTTFFFKHQ